MSTYWEKLKDPRWQKKRLEILYRDDWKCVVCDNKKTTLHVHHFYYIRGKNPWEYPAEHLKTLCVDCHSYYHEQLLELQMALAEYDVNDLFGIFLNTTKNGFADIVKNYINYEHDAIMKILTTIKNKNHVN
ncbi:hypothetical protein [Flavobacterium sp.]|uniref:HNH endonuclease n=1 Tax=Flavobacterium sp. TaxID=239 RepID=UPI002B4ADAB3|nr:hypothetical protein [Flavobacterium sp.]HLF52778.1 hypothetical protein [Flavobacterium sp.]